ncbi:T9SS type B sorting domain-containing protein [Hanstruepera neustonica]|uniref:T9SS type B sorting domain-containing protein n=1 Tax=Hanstruepera neustonica TaxID=1445657 RepID=UPI0013FD32F3|nr:gliding motility-associated C-terminal domain-containing protein [Hanstruepera neustonica]
MTYLFIVFFINSFAQCPTVSSATQSFCDIDDPTVADLLAIDNGSGIVWYDTPSSTTPLSSTAGLVDGEDYYADDNSGSCGIRERVDVTIYGAPFGLNFQGVCVDDPNDATISDLTAIGNNVQWYNVPSGGSPLAPTTVLTDNTIYYADQENPDTGCRTSRLSVLAVIGVVPVPTGNPIQTFCSENPPTVGDLIASGADNWYATNTSVIPLDPSTLLIDGENYFATSTDPPCESNDRFEVTVIIDDPGNSGSNGFTNICESEVNTIITIDLIDELSGTPDLSGTWSGPFATTNGSTGTVDITMMTTAGSPYVFTYTVDPGNTCSPTNSTVTVNISPLPNAGTNGSIDICNNDATQDLFTALGGTPDSGGTWSPVLASGTGLFDPAVDAPGVYTYTVAGTPPCPDASTSVTVTVVPEPNAGTNGSIDICNNDTTQDLFTALGGTPDSGGTWSPALASGTGLFDPTVDAPGVYTYTVAGTTPCPDASATVTVTVVPEPNAGTSSSIDICASDTTVQDLFTILGGTPDSGGTWSPALGSGTGLFDPTVDAPGVYTYTVAGTPPCPDASATVTVTVVPEPNAGTNGSIDICNNDATQDLFTALGGTPDSGGTWSPALASGTGLFDPAVDAPGIYTYTVAGTPPCPDASATVTVTVVPEPNAGTSSSINICASDTTVQDLFTILGGTPDSGGTWNPALASGTGLFDPAVDAPGVYTYTVAGTPPCPDASATVTVAVLPEPNAGTNGSIDICNNDATQDLFTALGGTPDSGGTWSPALASGTGLFDPAVDAPGVYTYTVAGTPPCPDASATVTVTVVPEPNAGTNGSIDICNNDATQDLFTALAGTPDSGGTWSPALASGTGLFDPTVDAPGVYTYTVAGTTPCPDASATVTVTVVPEPNAGTSSSIDICASDTTVQDLFTILGGTPDSGGTWSPALGSGTGLFDPTVDAPGVYTYTVAGTPPCPDASATVTVTVVPEPNAGTNGSIDICNNDATQDLFTALGGTPDSGGTWSPALASGTGLFDPAVDAPGIYTYTVAGTPPCPDASATVTVTVVPEPNAGTSSSINICASDTTVQDLFTILGGTPDSGGTWNPALASGTGLFDPAVDAPGVYTYTVAGTPPCPDASATVTVAVLPEPNAGTNGSIDICNNDATQDLFTALGGTPDSGGTWSPALASGTGLFDPAVDAPGVYTYTVAGTPPCPDASATVTVTVVPEPNAGTNGSIDICNNDATQDLFTALAGTPDSGGTWSPALASGTGLFDPAVDAPGIYTYTVAGTPPCPDASATVTVTVVPEPNAGDDGSAVICSNDGPQDLFNYITGNPDSGGIWSPALASGTGLFDPTVDAPGVYTYSVGPNSCNQRDSSEISVTIELNADATGLQIAVGNICLGLPNVVNLSGADFLQDGNYTLVYTLTNANNSSNSVDVVFSAGNSQFSIPESILSNIGTTTLTIISLIPTNSMCSADITSVASADFIVFENVTPEIIQEGYIFCEQDEPTISHLSANIIGNSPITWYDAPSNGNAYDNSTLLINGQTYYASTLTAEGCESIPRLEVTVLLNDCPDDIIIPDGFSPNDDGINDDFNIVNLRDLYPNFTLEIYNRYGNILYKGNRNVPNWNGYSDKGITLGNSKLPVGVYFYILKFNDGNRDPIQGRVYLSR